MTHRHLFLPPALRALGLAAVLAPLAGGPSLAGSDEASALFGDAPLVQNEVLAAERAAEDITITGDVGVNLAEQHGSITGNAIMAPTTSGALSSNRVSENRGLTISNFNTGNFNTFQTSVQYNIFLD